MGGFGNAAERKRILLPFSSPLRLSPTDFTSSVVFPSECEIVDQRSLVELMTDRAERNATERSQRRLKLFARLLH